MLKHATNVLLPLPKIKLEPDKVTGVEAWPQTIYKVRRLVPTKRHPGVDLQDLRVGNCCQTVTAGSVPLDSFMPDELLEEIRRELEGAKLKGLDAPMMAKLLERLDGVANNLGAINTAQVGQRLVVTLFNHGPEAVLFEGHLLGDAVSDDGQPGPGGRFGTLFSHGSDLG